MRRCVKHTYDVILVISVDILCNHAQRPAEWKTKWWSRDLRTTTYLTAVILTSRLSGSAMSCSNRRNRLCM